VIIRANSGDLLLITQPDHAELAATIIAEWRRDGFPAAPRRELILLAVRRHDDGWLDVDSSPLVDDASGRLLDYVHAPEPVRQAIWPKAVGRLRTAPWAAALVAEHAIHIFEQYRNDTGWQTFFGEMERARDTALAAVPRLTLEHLRQDYAFVRLADLLSLQFCDEWRAPQRDGPYETCWDGVRLTIRPDPFDGGQIHLAVNARRLPDRPFTPREAAEAFEAAPLVALSGVACGP
jgi:hypothetical protein